MKWSREKQTEEIHSFVCFPLFRGFWWMRWFLIHDDHHYLNPHFWSGYFSSFRRLIGWNLRHIFFRVAVLKIQGHVGFYFSEENGKVVEMESKIKSTESRVSQNSKMEASGRIQLKRIEAQRILEKIDEGGKGRIHTISKQTQRNTFKESCLRENVLWYCIWELSVGDLLGRRENCIRKSKP